jgi:carboxyl-terminal processing protease
MDFEAAQKGDKNYNSTTRDVKRLVEELKTENIDGLIIDLRFNGGGSLTEAIDLTGLFIPEGPVVQVKNSNGDIDIGEDEDPEMVYGGPLAVLTNRFSASASEIFAGAIQDYNRGVVIGEQTYGKGTVQNLIDLDRFMPEEKPSNQVASREVGYYGPGKLKMTIAKFYRINGSSTQHRGVTPDIELPSTFSAEEFGESSQPSALPWDQIKSTEFQVMGQIDPQTIKELEELHKERLQTEPALLNLIEDNKEFNKVRSATVVSLKESVREKEREEAEELRAARAKLSGSLRNLEGDTEPIDDEKPKVSDDPYLQEGARILLDLIASNIG